MKNRKVKLLIVLAACPSFLGLNCAGNGGIPLRIFPPGELVEFGTRKSIPLTQLLGCGQADGSQGFTVGPATLSEIGSLGAPGAGADLSISATAQMGTDSIGQGHCLVQGDFTVSAPGSDTIVTGNVDATLATNCVLSDNINGYSVVSSISLLGDAFGGNNLSQSQEFCYEIRSPGTNSEIVECNDPINGISFIFLTIRDFNFRVGVTYTLVAEFTVNVSSSSALPELGGEIACTMTVQDVSVCLDPGGCN